MKYHAEQEQQLLEDLLAFSHDPLGAILYAFPWGVAGTPLETFELRTWQREDLEAIGKHVREQQGLLDMGLDEALRVFQEVIASGRGTGKSALFGMLTWWFLTCHIGASAIVTANTEKQLRTKTFPEFGKWFTLAINSHWWTVETLAVRPQDWIAKLVRDQLKIDTQKWAATGQNWTEENPDAFAGEHNMYGLAVFYDEASGIPNPVWVVTKGFFTEMTPFRLWIGFSQGRRNSGPFFDRFHDPVYAPYWRKRHLDARTVEGTDKSVYDEIIATKGAQSDEARVEVYGLFPEQGEGQLIPNTTVLEAQKRRFGMSEDNDEPLILGVDPAPRGRTVLRARQGRDAYSIKPQVLEGKNNTQIADAIVEFANKYDPDAIVVDAGNGTGVIDELRRRGTKVIEVWFGAANPNADDDGWALIAGAMWGRMASWLERGGIDDSSELYKDLTKRRWEWFGGREDNKKTLNSKRDMKQEGIPSPDDGDALALTFFPSLPKRNKNVHGGRPNQTRIAQGVGECYM